MPTLDPPVVDGGAGEGPPAPLVRHRWHPVTLAATAFLMAMLATVVVVLLVSAIAG